MQDVAKRRAAKYRRISDDREGRELGVQRQDEDLDELGERRGLEFVASYVDNDVSASTSSRKPRPDYEQMLLDARAGHFEVIAAYTTGRITRRPREFEDLIDLSVQHSIEFQYIRSPEFDLSTANGRMVARMLAAKDANESEEMAERIQREARQRAERGELAGGGTRPFGFEVDRLTIRESEARLVREAARRVLDGGETVRGLCREWNEREVATVTGAPWKPHVLRRMLMSARISGRREHRGVILADAVWPGIIAHDESDRLRELLGDPARTTNGGDTARRYLLTGFLHCGIGGCGLRLIARPQGDHQRSYVCATVGQSHLRIHAESLELYVTEAALDYLDEFVNLRAAVGAGADASVEAKLWAALSNYQRRLDDADRARWVLETLPEARHLKVATELQAAIDRTREELARVQSDKAVASLPATSAQARALWNERGLHWRRTLLRALVERVTVGPGVRGRNRFDPDRVSITWRRPA